MSVRYHKADPVEMEFQFRAAADGSATFEGYASVFNQRSKPIVDELAQRGRPYVETILPGAFKRTLGSGRRQSFVVDHDERRMISSTQGALRLAEDSKGLHVESPWPRTDYADNVRGLFDAGERLGMSMLFATPAKGDEWPTPATRNVSEAILKHVSVLATMEPAYSGTSATFRALADLTEAPVEDVDALMDALRDGRRLDEGEYNLLTRLADAVKPESAPVEVAAVQEATGRSPEDWLARIEARKTA